MKQTEEVSEKKKKRKKAKKCTFSLMVNNLTSFLNLDPLIETYMNSKLNSESRI